MPVNSILTRIKISFDPGCSVLNRGVPYWVRLRCDLGLKGAEPMFYLSYRYIYCVACLGFVSASLGLNCMKWLRTKYYLFQWMQNSVGPDQTLGYKCGGWSGSILYAFGWCGSVYIYFLSNPIPHIPLKIIHSHLEQRYTTPNSLSRLNFSTLNYSCL